MALAAKKRVYKDCPARGFVYVWEGPVRITHWVNVISIIILILTGLYIHYPFVRPNPVDAPYMMGGTTRYIHYVTGIIFAASIMVRIWWAFVGNKYAHIKTFYNPFNKKKTVHISSHI